jgi:beta-glucosidase
MKKTVLILFSILISYTAMAQQPPQLGKSSVDEVIKAMTLEEKASLVIGSVMPEFGSDSGVVGFTDKLVPGAAGTTFPIERLGIPPIVLADGPAGLRISPTREGDKNTYYCTAFPVATLLASTWNTELVENVGKAIGNEVLEYGADVLLAPALNIHRNPLCGRNFEYYSEDPLISGKITAAIVRGVQSNGVGTSIKHFAANNQEINRFSNDALISQRALREIYLKGFEIAIKESNPWTLMTSYNLVNGVYTSEDRKLLTNVLRNEWGFKGVVMTDWFGGKTAPLQIYAGNDLLMPGRLDQKEAILNAVRDGSLHESYLDADVRRILHLVLASPRFKGYPFSNKPDLKAHAAVARQSAAEGMVLLKNDGNTLPLAKSVKKVAALGVTSYDFISGGKGSGDVYKAYNVSLTDGLKNNKYILNDDLKQTYETYIAGEKAKFKSDSDNPFTVFLAQRIQEWIPDEALLSSLAQKTDVAFITIGRSSGEFYDRKVEDDFNLTDEEQALISQTCKAFHEKGKKVIVILNVCGVIETASWKSQPDAILLAWQAGQEGGNAVADILTGKANPSGRLATTFPVNYNDVPSANFPSDYSPEKSSMIGGRTKPVNPAEWIPNVDYTVYAEGIFVGYRYYDTYNKAVSFPFGYGLSYTTFQYSDAQISHSNGTITVSVDIKNTGNKAGKEVVGLYVAAPQNQSLPKPAKELKAFAKTKELAPGEAQTIRLSVKTTDLASYDETAKQWLTDAGNYQFLLGASSVEIKEVLEVNIK